MNALQVVTEVPDPASTTRAALFMTMILLLVLTSIRGLLEARGSGRAANIVQVFVLVMIVIGVGSMLVQVEAFTGLSNAFYGAATDAATQVEGVSRGPGLRTGLAVVVVIITTVWAWKSRSLPSYLFMLLAWAYFFLSPTMQMFLDFYINTMIKVWNIVF